MVCLAWKIYGSHAHGLFCDQLLFISNRAAMIEETLAQLNAPPTAGEVFGYLPPIGADDVVIVSRIDRLASLMPDLTPVFHYGNSPNDPVNKPLSKMLIRPPDLFAGSGCAATTIRLSPDRVEWTSMLNLLTHPSYAAYAGEAKPLHLARSLPENCRILGSFQISDCMHRMVETRLLPWLEIFRDPGGRLEAIRQIAGILNGEIAFGLASSEENVPQAFLMAEISRTDAIAPLLGRLVSMTPWQEEVADARLQSARFNEWPGLTMYVAPKTKTVFIGTEREALRSLASRVLDGLPTRVFEARTPPFDSSAAYYARHFEYDGRYHSGCSPCENRSGRLATIYADSLLEIKTPPAMRPGDVLRTTSWRLKRGCGTRVRIEVLLPFYNSDSNSGRKPGNTSGSLPGINRNDRLPRRAISSFRCAVVLHSSAAVARLG